MGKIAELAKSQQNDIEKPRVTIADVLKKQWPKCDIATLLSCVMKCSALGLEPSAVDGLGRAYILPFRNHGRMEATFILGYKGMIALARRSGEIEDISARAVYEGDEFEYEFGLNEKLRHVPGNGEHTPDKLTYVYMVCHFKDGGHYIDVMTKAEVEAVRKRSKANDKGPWATDYEAMARKTVVRRAFPYLPVSIEAQSAAVSDETTGGFTADLSRVIPPSPSVPEYEVPESENEAQEPSPGRKAACKTCGNVIDNVTEDAELSDIKFQCCDNPDYEWVV
ncbi:MAG TPA: recombinase RecT [Candidatus Gordonibacter avicola]|nr:recombinase RecT [Candidatus Gordonibacter avicola]